MSSDGPADERDICAVAEGRDEKLLLHLGTLLDLLVPNGPAIKLLLAVSSV